MEHEARIRRMEEAGLLTPEQAAALRDSLPKARPEAPAPRQHLPLAAVVVGGLALLAVVAVVLASLAGDGGAIQNVAETINQPGGTGEMNRTLSTVLAVALLLVIPLVVWVWIHNSLVDREEAVYSAWAQVESNYQRRSDLVPALVETVSRYLRHESETLTEVTRERSQGLQAFQKAVDDLVAAQRASGQQLDALGGHPPAEAAALAAVAAGQESVGLGMRRLLAIAENYPELRSADQFLTLQAQIEGTENRINVARMRFNEAAQSFNAAIRRLPASLVASVAGMQRKAYFTAKEGAENASDLGFD